MMSSRGMGAISPSKMPGKKVVRRKDKPQDVDMYKHGGKVKDDADWLPPSYDLKDFVGDLDVTPSGRGIRVSTGNIPLGRKTKASLGMDTDVTQENRTLKAKPSTASVKAQHDFDSGARLGARADFGLGNSKGSGFGEISGSYPINERNTIRGSLAGSHQDGRNSINRASAEWEHKFSPNTTGTLSADASPEEKRVMLKLHHYFKAKGGEVRGTPNPAKKHKKLTPAKKVKAKAAAKVAGRLYPNLIDNMRMAK